METRKDMSTDLLSMFSAAQNTPSAEAVDNAKSELTQTPVVELVGVNSPEFEFEPLVANQNFVEQVADELSEDIAEIPSELEKSFDHQNGEKNVIELSLQDDGLGDDELPLTQDHVEVTELQLNYDEVEEDALESTNTTSDLPEWSTLPIDFEELGLKTRTVNTLRNSGIAHLSMLKGMHISEIKGLKGMGASSLDDILTYFEAKGVSDWIDTSRKSRDESLSGDMYATSTSKTASAVEVAREEATPKTVEEVGVQSATETTEVISTPTEEAPTSTAVTPNTKEDPKPQIQAPSASLKLLVLGNASSSSGNGRIVSFEAVYGRQIANICAQNNVPSISLIEYSKGWSTLAANIRQLGWPQGVDVMCVSKSFAIRSEIMLELRLLADVVVEG